MPRIVEKTSRFASPGVEGVDQPGPREGPEPVGTPRREPEQDRRLGEGQAGEESKFDQFRRLRVRDSKAAQSVVEFELLAALLEEPWLD